MFYKDYVKGVHLTEIKISQLQSSKDMMRREFGVSSVVSHSV